MQVASLGLVKALDGFDPERGGDFNAYAAPTILGELRRHFRDRVYQLRLPRRLQDRTMAVVRVHAYHYHLGCATYRPRRAGDRAVAAGGADEPDG